MTHGTPSAYDSGCRCQECAEANATALRSAVGSVPAAAAPQMTVVRPAPSPGGAIFGGVLRHLTDHVASEAGFISSYRELAEAPATPEAVRYLIRLVIEDEERHHRVLHEIVTAIEGGVSLQAASDAVPNLPHEPPDRTLEEVTSQFLAAERSDAKQLRALRKELRPFRDTSLWVLLVELMEQDTAKHIRLLSFIRDHIARQPLRYLAVSRALDRPFEATPES